jgi:hypothetical protein
MNGLGPVGLVPLPAAAEADAPPEPPAGVPAVALIPAVAVVAGEPEVAAVGAPVPVEGFVL